MKNKLMSMIGFAKKAGKISSGEGITLENIKKNKSKLVILANDASENTAKRIKDKAKYRDIAVLEILNRREIGKSIGAEEKVVLSILDIQFANSMKEIAGGVYEEN